MNLVWRIMQAELVSRIRDKSFWLEALLLPIVVTVIMGVALGNLGRGKTPVIHVGIVAGSSDWLPVEVLESAFKSTGTLKTEFYAKADAARSALSSSKVDALVFVTDFDPTSASGNSALNATVESGRTTQFQAGMVAQITEATLRALAAELGARRAVAGLLSDIGTDPTPAWVTPTPVPVSARLEEVPLKRFDLLASQFAGMAIFFSLLSAFRIMTNIFGDHRQGLNLRLAGVPTKPAFVAMGFVLSVATVAITQTITVLVLGSAAFGVKWGPIVPMVLATVCASLASAALALALAVLPGSSTTRGLIGTLVVLGGSVLGGALVPIDGSSSTLQWLAHSTLHFWVTGLFTGLSRGLTISQVWDKFLGVMAYGMVALVLATFFMARRQTARA